MTQVNAVRADMASRALKPVMGRSNITVGPGWLCTLVTVWILGGPPSFVLGTVGLFVVLGLCVCRFFCTQAAAVGLPHTMMVWSL